MILIFSVLKSQNSNEEENISIRAKAYLKIASCGFLATVTFNNQSPFITLRANFWTLYFIFAGARLMLKTPESSYVIPVKHRLEPILTDGIHIQSR